MITFKQFLFEGGAATAKWGTSRATTKDIKTALEFVAKVLHVKVSYLEDRLLGGTVNTFNGYKPDSGDVDLGFEVKNLTQQQELHDKMAKAVGGEVFYNPGMKLSSFAVPVGNKKKIQVDFMYVPHLEWAKFAYHSGEGRDSNYKGALRQILMSTIARYRNIPGEDVSILDDEGHEIIRASRSYTLDRGLVRLFKVAKMRKDGKGRTKNLVNATPAEVAHELNVLGKNEKFSKDADPIQDPKKVLELLFGKGVTEEDVSSAEGIIKLIQDPKRFNKQEAKEILEKAGKAAKERGLKIPPELDQ